MIDIERNYPEENGGIHKTVNNGLIEIENAENSIGIDYGEYSDFVFKSELTIGDIIVGGKKNYGLRMANIYTSNNAFFDRGVTIKSGGADKKDFSSRNRKTLEYLLLNFFISSSIGTSN